MSSIQQEAYPPCPPQHSAGTQEARSEGTRASLPAHTCLLGGNRGELASTPEIAVGKTIPMKARSSLWALPWGSTLEAQPVSGQCDHTLGLTASQATGMPPRIVTQDSCRNQTCSNESSIALVTSSLSCDFVTSMFSNPKAGGGQ